MERRIQKRSEDNCRQKDRVELKSYLGVRAFIGMAEGNIADVHFMADYFRKVSS